MPSSDAAAYLEELRDALAPAYRVERVIGRGGAATVFLADDRKHERRVAIKVLHRDLAATVGGERFVQEIRVAARLTHPNIVPLLDSGQAGVVPYYVMPYIEGESLRGRLQREGRLALGDALALVAQVADALEYAHAAGIVHRDIKPENILLLRGHALVADFGIARAITQAGGSASRTSQGIVLGTPAYMSPEQAAGEVQLDGRSDVYALATTLFELLAGELPFRAPSVAALIAMRFREAAPRLSSRVPGLPAVVDDAVASALAVEPTDRPASPQAFAQALLGGDARRAGETSAFATHATASRPTPFVSNPGQPSVVVLPFTNVGNDPEHEFLADGITEEIITTLSRLRTVRVAARASSFALRDRRGDLRGIAEQLGVTNVLDGSVRHAAGRVRVSAELVDAQTGFQLWADRMDRPLADAFEIQDDIARAIADALSATLLHDTGVGRDAVPGEAYERYLRGRYALNRRTETELAAAVEHFTAAQAQAPAYALAAAGLAEARLLQGVYGAQPATTVMPLARDAALQALALDPALGDAQATLGAVRALHDWDWTGAADAFRRATALSPRSPQVWQWRAMHVLLPTGQLDEARTSIDRARALDPLAIVIASSVGVVYHLAGDPAGAVRALQRALSVAPEFAMAHYFLGGALRDAGELDAALSAFEAAIARGGATPEMTAGLAQTLARRGDEAGARRLLGALHETARTRHVSSCLFAQVHASLGETSAAVTALEAAAAVRDPELIYIGVRPSYAPLKGTAGFDALRRRLGV